MTTYFYKGLNKMGCVYIYIYSAIVFFRILRRFICVFIFIEIQVSVTLVYRTVWCTGSHNLFFPMTWNWDQHEFNVYKIDLLIVSPHKL
jgi:hypothetical protein